MRSVATRPGHLEVSCAPDRVAALARNALLAELSAYPKPGLVSHVDAGSHDDMDADTFTAAIDAIVPFFADLARGGATGADMGSLRRIGLRAETAMLAATNGVNTHRGAIFGLGLLSAAAGALSRPREGALGAFVRETWGASIMSGPVPATRPGASARRKFKAGGAPAEAAAGFPTVYGIGLPALARTRNRGTEAAMIEVCMALIAAGGDTNLLHRGGRAGARYAQETAARFLAKGGTGHAQWRERASRMHRAFVVRRLSPGGAADLLAMTIFVASVERTWP